MQTFYQRSILAFVFFVSYSLAMEQDTSEKSQTNILSHEQSNAQAPLLVDQCSKAIADRLAKDLLEQRDYTTWLNLEKLPEELQHNILKSLCKDHSDIVWQYSSNLISLKRLTDNIGDKCHDYSVKISSNNRFIAAFRILSYRKIWDLSTNNRLFQDEKIIASDFSSDSKYIVIACKNGENDTIKIWQTTHNEFLPISFETQDSKITAIKISEDNKLIAVAFQDGTIKLFDVETSICLNNIQTPDSINNEWNIIKSIFITKDQKFIITTSRTKQIRIWNLSTKECVKTIEALFLNAFSFNPDAKQLFLVMGGVCRGKLLVIDATTGNILLENKEKCPIASVCASLNTKIIALGFADGKVKILNRETNENITFGDQLNDIESLELSSDNKVVVTASIDNTIKLWNAKTQKCINKFDGDSIEMWQQISGGLNLTGVLSVAISQNNDLIAAGLNDGVVKIWQIDLSKGLQAILEEIKKNINLEKQTITK